jgi:hypothetical protein
VIAIFSQRKRAAKTVELALAAPTFQRVFSRTQGLQE